MCFKELKFYTAENSPELFNVASSEGKEKKNTNKKNTTQFETRVLAIVQVV